MQKFETTSERTVKGAQKYFLLEPSQIQAMSATDRKQDILRLLGILERSDTFHGHPFQARAYSKVMTQIKELPAVRTISDVAGVKGVGKEIKLKIETILATGTLPSAEHAGANPQFAAYDALLGVYGVGPVKARGLIEAGIMNIDALRAEVARNPKLLTAAQKLGLQYYEDTQERIPRAEMMEHEAVLRRAFCAAGLTMQVVGSYRRGLASSGDIDCLVSSGVVGMSETDMSETDMKTTFRGVVERLIADGYIVGVLAKGDAKTLAYATVGGAGGKSRPSGSAVPARRLDLLLTAPAQYPYAILYFTGSDLFNIAMRGWALERGYTMNEHGMTPTSPDKPAAPVMKSEEDIFAFLGLQYVAPTARVNGDQIGAQGSVSSASTVAPVTIAITKKLKLKLKAPVSADPEPVVEKSPEPPKSIKIKLKKLKTE
jgi:DNA polymerase/3'-5' exonuclease PolX